MGPLALMFAAIVRAHARPPDPADVLRPLVPAQPDTSLVEVGADPAFAAAEDRVRVARALARLFRLPLARGGPHDAPPTCPWASRGASLGAGRVGMRLTATGYYVAGDTALVILSRTCLAWAGRGPALAEMRTTWTLTRDGRAWQVAGPVRQTARPRPAPARVSPNETLQLSGMHGRLGAPAATFVGDRRSAWTTRS